jgi:hypothetical protein
VGPTAPVAQVAAPAGPFPVDQTSAHAFGRALPLRDPVEAQKLVCVAIGRLVLHDSDDDARLAALLVLDRYARQIREMLLVRYVEGDAQLRALDRTYWQSAMRLSQSFFNAYEQFQQGGGHPYDVSGPASVSCLLTQLFLHRKFEFLLRLFRYKKPNAEHWRGLHEAYVQARADELTSHPVVVVQADGKPGPATTLEQQYIQILLLDMMNGGQYSPRELLWASSWFMDWSSALPRLACQFDANANHPDHGFVVDLGSGTGLKRVSPESTGSQLVFDPSPLMLLIDDKVTALRDPTAHRRWSAPVEREAQIALLARLRILLAPSPVLIERRGERTPVAQSVQAIVGLAGIARMLRESGRAEIHAIASSANQSEGDTILPFHGNARMPSPMPQVNSQPAAFATDDDLAALQQPWQVKDRSDSGCRMRGQIRDLNLWIPGSLVAMREDANAPWTLSVVRRFKRLMVDRVEIGVEHIGCRPRFVKIVTDVRLDPASDDLPEASRRSFAAIYLPASEQLPAMPIKTLLLPAREFKSGSVVMLLSSRSTYVLRLNAPIQQHMGFVWTSFAIVDKQAATAAANGSEKAERSPIPGARVPLGTAAAHP